MLDAFTTDRLRIQQLTPDDAEELAAISNVPEVYQWMAFMEGGLPTAKAAALIAAQEETKEFFFAVRLANGPMIGAVGVIDHPDQTIEIGYWLGVDHQKKGYAYEALQGCSSRSPLDRLLLQGRSSLKHIQIIQPPLDY